jgi:hypothetical protein
MLFVCFFHIKCNSVAFQDQEKITAVAFAVLHEQTMVAAAAMCAAQRE